VEPYFSVILRCTPIQKDATKVVIILLFHIFILVSKFMHLKVNIANIKMKSVVWHQTII